MKIICVGRNYPEHAKELRNPVPEEPVIFLKPSTALLPAGSDFMYPGFSEEVHYECELVIRICRPGKDIPLADADRYYKEWTAGIDFTARDLQSRLKKKSLPWELAKAFDGSAAIGNWQSVTGTARFCFFKNEEKVQEGYSKDMLFSIPYILHFVSRYFSLEAGDLLFTGTPPGVGALHVGDQLRTTLNGETCLYLSVSNAH